MSPMCFRPKGKGKDVFENLLGNKNKDKKKKDINIEEVDKSKSKKRKPWRSKKEK